MCLDNKCMMFVCCLWAGFVWLCVLCKTEAEFECHHIIIKSFHCVGTIKTALGEVFSESKTSWVYSTNQD